jgi:death-on-curing protein
MKEPVWIDRTTLGIAHGESLARHGGLTGVRDEGMLESALARPINLHLYEQCSDLCRLAAAYAFGLARNHPFLDGNKRIAFIAAAAFLELNGLELFASQVEVYENMIHLADSSWHEDQFADWLRQNVK